MKFRLAARAAAFTIIAMTMSSAVPLMAQGRGGMAPAAPVDPHDLSGFWELSSEWKSVPPADLLPGITRATLQKVHDADLISERWCRPIGMPALMDNGRPLGLLQGSYELLITTEANTAPRHLYFRPAHVSAEIFDPDVNRRFHCSLGRRHIGSRHDRFSCEKRPHGNSRGRFPDGEEPPGGAV